MSNLVDKAMELQVMTCLDSLLDRANHDEYLGRIGKKEALKFLEENRQYVEIIKLRLRRLEAIDNANPSKALKSLESVYYGSQGYGDIKKHYEIVKQALLKAQKDEKIILGIEDYINLRIKVEPIEDVRKAFIEIRNQLQVIKEVLE